MNNCLYKSKLVLSPFATGLDISLQERTVFLSPDAKIKLKRFHRVSSTRTQGDKIKAILLLDQGYEYSEITSILLIDNSIVWWGV